MHSSGAAIRDQLLGAVIEGTAGVRYHVRKVLGEGGQGWVYKANYDDPEGFWIVVKVLRPEGLHGDALKRFEREAEVLRKLGAVRAPNPNIVRFYDYGVHSVGSGLTALALPFIVLEHVEGQTLAKVIGAHGGFGIPMPRARRIAKQIARALEAIHEERIVHRDLKPSNILLAQVDGQELAKVTDFGLVKIPDLKQTTSSLAGASLGYAPPEQYELGNGRVGPQTDVFSFAAVLYEMLCGSVAFASRGNESALRVVGRMLSGDRPQLARVSATVPRELRERPDLTAAIDRELARALSADPAVRHASIRELWERVEPLLLEAMQGKEPSIVEEPSHDTEIARGASSCPPTPTFQVVGKAMTGERLRAAVVAPDGKSIVALGSHGLYHFARGVWSAMHLPVGVDTRFVRGIARGGSGDLLLYGDNGFAMSLAPAGVAQRMRIVDRDLVLLGAHVDERGLVFVGERLSRPVAVVVEAAHGSAPKVTTLESAARLHGVTRVASGRLLVCGTHGALLEIGDDASAPRDVPWGRTGHLYAIAAANDGGAFAVGSGGHALRISPAPDLPGLDAPPAATLEAVQTTRDLSAVVVDADGVAWAVGGQARLLQRKDGLWTRITLDASIQGTLIAVHARSDGVTIVAEDGLVAVSGPSSPASRRVKTESEDRSSE